MKMRQCTNCGFYTMKTECPKCGKETKEAHYKFVKVKSEKENKD